MNTKEINTIIVAQMEAHFGTYDSLYPDVNKNFAANFARDPIAYRLGPINFSNMDCNNADIMDFALTHPEYSHFSVKGSGNCQYVAVYWHAEGSPTGVTSVGSFNVENIQKAYEIRKDPIGGALAWCNGWE